MRNRDELQGRLERMKGRARQAAGDLTDNERMRERGEVEELGGAVREGAGKVRRKAGEAVQKLGKKIKR